MIFRNGGNLTSHTPAHNVLLPLLPSGPGGVHRLLLRGDRLDHHKNLRFNVKRKRRALSAFSRTIARLSIVANKQVVGWKSKAPSNTKAKRLPTQKQSAFQHKLIHAFHRHCRKAPLAFPTYNSFGVGI
jgi:hypothetical protein